MNSTEYMKSLEEVIDSMNKGNKDFRYAIGDIVKVTKTLFHERYSNRPMVVVGQAKSFSTNEYKVIVCGYENEFYYFMENDIEGAYE